MPPKSIASPRLTDPTRGPRAAALIKPVVDKTITPVQIPSPHRFDALNMTLAGLRDGAGPILTLYLVRDVHLDPISLSWVIAAPGIASMCVQTPIGFVYDRIDNKRLPLMIGALMMGLTCLAMSLVTNFYGLMFLQLFVGTATCLMGLGIPALSLASTGPEGLAKRLARNEVFAKIGNFSTLGLIGYLTQAFSLRWVFYVIPLLSIPVAALAKHIPFRVPPVVATIDENNLRDSRLSVYGSLKAAVGTRGIWLLAFIVFLFDFTDAPQLMIFEQSFAKTAANGGSAVIASALVVTQITISLTIIGLARLRIHPIRVMIVGFALIGIRALIFALDYGIPGLYVAQILDGIAAGIILTVPMRLVAQANTRHFNILSGVLGSCVSLGATLSTLMAGYIIAGSNHRTAFQFFALAALIGLIVSLSRRKVFETPRGI